MTTQRPLISYVCSVSDHPACLGYVALGKQRYPSCACTCHKRQADAIKLTRPS